MKKTMLALALIVIGAVSFQTHADILNIGGMRTNIYSFSNKSFDGAETEIRSMQTITGISNDGPLNVVYVQSDRNEVEVQGDKELFNRVKTQWKNGIVHISLDAGTYRNLWLQVVVFAPALNDVKCTGSGNLLADKLHTNTEELDMRVTGSAKIKITELTCDRNLDINITGSGDVRVQQLTCQMLDANVTGSGDIMVEQGQCFNIEAKVSGSGGFKFNNIDANAATLSVLGSGDIRLLDGEIKYLKSRITGSGSISGKLKYESSEQKVTGSGSFNITKK